MFYLIEHEFMVSKNQCSIAIIILNIKKTRFNKYNTFKVKLEIEILVDNQKKLKIRYVMDGIQAELNAAVNAFNQNEFQKMLEETEQVLDAST